MQNLQFELQDLQGERLGLLYPTMGGGANW